MPFFQLNENDLSFPPAHFADEQGMIAVGGDLSVKRVLAAYRQGIFFWFGPMDFIKWWSPDPRVLVYPTEVAPPAPEQMEDIEVTFDHDLEGLLCAIQEKENQPPMGENWLTEEMINLYRELHQRGILHSLELKRDGAWIGGICGMAIGKAFFAEYTYAATEDGGTLALRVLARQLADQGYTLIDLQKETNQVNDIDLQELSRMAYLDLVREACQP